MAKMLFILFISAAAIIWFVFKKKREFKRLIDIKIERIEKEKNILLAKHKEHNIETETLKKRLKRYSALKEVVRLFSSNLSLTKVSELIVEKAFEVVGKSERCCLFLIDNERQSLTLSGSISSSLPYKVSHNGNADVRDLFDNWVLYHRQPLIVKDTRNDFRFSIDAASREQKNMGSLIAAPLISEKGLLGILRMDGSLPRIYSVDDLRLLNIIADLAAVSVRDAQLYQRTEELAIKDGLTGLYVHRYFQEHLEEELTRAAQNERSCSLLMLDIDHFKNYNDKYGHVAGDIVLTQIAEILKSMAVPGSVMARYGGEEFGVILPGMDKHEALSLAEEIRKEIETRPFLLRRQETRVTISIGVVSFPWDGSVREDVLRKADIALYKAKESGRNKVCTA